ncbi:MAG: 30S ribosomal protein S15 [Candidatus Brocadiia bacterium]|jgi:small subunit ribosomal protein S15|nr:30S ribosomal protein S15 [Candidatus Brocadiia bacterium]
MDTAKKTGIIEAYRVHETDSGSPEVQVAILTSRISELTDHLRKHKHDYATRRGLLKLVGQRTAMLRYLMRKDEQRYRNVIRKLGLRR